MNDLMVTIDVDALKVPCELIDLRFTSKKGRQHTVSRYFLPADAAPGVNPTEMTSPRGIQEVAEAMAKGEGCKIRGVFYMHFLSNHFYIGFGNHQMLAQVARINKNKFIMDLSHKVNHLSFGPDNEVYFLQK